MLFASAAVAGGIILAYAARPSGLLDSATFTFARAVTYEIMNLYAVKMAAVFMISTSTLAIRTGNYRTLDCVHRLCFRTASPAERALYWLDFNAIPSLDPVDQHLHP